MRYLFLITLFFTTSLFGAPSCRIKAVVFDFGGVIIDRGDPSSFLNYISEQLGTNKEETRLLVREFKEAINQGMLAEKFWEGWALAHDKRLPPCWIETYEKKGSLLIKPIEGMVELVKELAQLGYQTPLLSNVDLVHAHFIRRTGLYNMFCPLLLSYELGVEKPDPHIYKILLVTLNLTPEAVIFIDDKEQNVEAALKLGIDAIHFQSLQQLKEELIKRDVLVKRK